MCALIIPQRLRPRDVVGLVTPASPVRDASRIDAGVRYLERNGLRVKLGSHVRSVYGYLAGADQERADDLHEMFRDPEVKAVFALRGGYGATRILPLLDFDLLRRHPKILVGYSDITALLLSIYARSSLLTFHGPMAAVEFAVEPDPAMEELFWDTVFGRKTAPSFAVAEAGARRVLRPGFARGRLLGGNLSLLAAMAGTPYLPDFTGSLFFIEEIGEEPYRVDRMITQLLQAGVLGGVAGILAGQFTDCAPKDPTQPSLSVDDVLRSLSEKLFVPFVSGCRIGHVPNSLTLPIGILAELDAETSSLTFLEPVVANGPAGRDG